MFDKTIISQKPYELTSKTQSSASTFIKKADGAVSKMSQKSDLLGIASLNQYSALLNNTSS